MTTEPDDSDMILILEEPGPDLDDFLRSGVRPLRRIVVRHKESGPFYFDAEYTREDQGPIAPAP
jgi:hypothetical protein